MKALEMSMLLSKFKYFFLIAGWLTACPIAIQAQQQLEVASNSVGETSIDLRRQFLQNNFSKFMPVQFQKDENGLVLLQRLPVKGNLFGSGSNYYCGFKFTAPLSFGGDLGLVYALANNEAEKDFTAKPIESNIISEKGDTATFYDSDVENLADWPQFQKQLPYTKSMLVRHLDKNGLQRGKTYGIWFGFNETNLPDIAFAIIVDSLRGRKVSGEFPSFKPAQVLVNTKAHPTSAEQLRSEIEAAIKVKDINALSELFCWQDVPEEQKTQNIEDALPTWFILEPPTVTLSSLQPWDKQRYVVNGMITRANITILGWVNVTVDQDGNADAFPYGKFGDGYYIATWLHEPVKN
jgi:hypothetical protein